MIHALALTGPTASGKTALSIKLSQRLCCEIISCDSMQIYKGMDVGTAKATVSEQRQAPHHMIDIITPDESFSANAYRAMALPIAKSIAERGKTPLFVGGTGLYLSTVIRNSCDEVPESDPAYRERIEAGLATEADRVALWERLQQIDPASAALSHYNNTRRVIRALEIYETTGKTKSYFDERSRLPSPDISITHVTLDIHDRETLYKRADARVDAMLKDGLLEETERLYKEGLLKPEYTAAQAIGYKEMLGVITGEVTMPEATERLKQATRNYAKRQLTWFRHDATAARVFLDTEDGRMRSADDLLEECIMIFTEAQNRH